MSTISAREARPASPAPAGASAPASTSGAASGEESAFHRVLRGIGHEVERGETTMRGALTGGDKLSGGNLLALQAGVYRYSEVVDLAAKLVDRAQNAVKTVVQGQ